MVFIQITGDWMQTEKICELIMVFMKPELWLYTTIGDTYAMEEEYDEALKYFQLAYDYDDRKQIFESDDNKYMNLVERR
jgi:hypothetical protein